VERQDDPGALADALADAFVIGWTLAVVCVKIALSVGLIVALQVLGVPEVASYFAGGFALLVMVGA
jgi:hypothetical protein